MCSNYRKLQLFKMQRYMYTITPKVPPKAQGTALKRGEDCKSPKVRNSPVRLFL